MAIILGFRGLQRFLRMSEVMQLSQFHRLFGGRRLHLPDNENLRTVNAIFKYKLLLFLQRTIKIS